MNQFIKKEPDVAYDFHNLSYCNIKILPIADRDIIKVECSETLLENISLSISEDKIYIQNKKNYNMLSNNDNNLTIYIPLLKNLIHEGLGKIEVKCPIMNKIINKNVGKIEASIFYGKNINSKSTGIIKIYEINSFHLSINSEATSQVYISSGLISKLSAELAGVSKVTIEAKILDLIVKSTSVEDFTATYVENCADIHNDSVGTIKVNGPFKKELICVNDGVGEIILKKIYTESLVSQNFGIGSIYLSGVADNIEIEDNLGDTNSSHLMKKNIKKKNYPVFNKKTIINKKMMDGINIIKSKKEKSPPIKNDEQPSEPLTQEDKNRINFFKKAI